MYRLKGGIVGYAKYIQQLQQQEEEASVATEAEAEAAVPVPAVSSGVKSLFRGLNYVFDGRLVERVTDDLLDNECVSCGTPCNVPTNCMFCNVSWWGHCCCWWRCVVLVLMLVSVLRNAASCRYYLLILLLLLLLWCSCGWFSAPPAARPWQAAARTAAWRVGGRVACTEATVAQSSMWLLGRILLGCGD